MRHGWQAAMAGLAMLAGCASEPLAPGVPEFVSAEITHDDEGRCWGRDIAPAVIQTVTAHEIDTPAVLAEDGTVLTPATYRSVTRQEIVRERGEQAFETICPPVYTEEFVASLQRALAARGFYRGEVTGVMDTATGRAVQDFQREDGPDSPLLSIAAARRLGLIELTREQVDAL